MKWDPKRGEACVVTIPIKCRRSPTGWHMLKVVFALETRYDDSGRERLAAHRMVQIETTCSPEWIQRDHVRQSLLNFGEPETNKAEAGHLCEHHKHAVIQHVRTLTPRGFWREGMAGWGQDFLSNQLRDIQRGIHLRKKRNGTVYAKYHPSMVRLQRGDLFKRWLRRVAEEVGMPQVRVEFHEEPEEPPHGSRRTQDVMLPPVPRVVVSVVNPRSTGHMIDIVVVHWKTGRAQVDRLFLHKMQWLRNLGMKSDPNGHRCVYCKGVYRDRHSHTRSKAHGRVIVGVLTEFADRIEEKFDGLQHR